MDQKEAYHQLATRKIEGGTVCIEVITRAIQFLGTQDLEKRVQSHLESYPRFTLSFINAEDGKITRIQPRYGEVSNYDYILAFAGIKNPSDFLKYKQNFEMRGDDT